MSNKTQEIGAEKMPQSLIVRLTSRAEKASAQKVTSLVLPRNVNVDY